MSVLPYTHFTLEERKYLQKLLEEGLSGNKIAAALGRSPSSISRELKRNRSKNPKKPTNRANYHHWRAHSLAMMRRRDLVHGKRLVSTRKHETCSYDQQPKKNTSGRKRLPPAEPTLQRARFPQRKAEDRHRQRYQQQKDCRKVPADAVKDLRGKICDNISAHADHR